MCAGFVQLTYLCDQFSIRSITSVSVRYYSFFHMFYELHWLYVTDFSHSSIPACSIPPVLVLLYLLFSVSDLSLFYLTLVPLRYHVGCLHFLSVCFLFLSIVSLHFYVVVPVYLSLFSLNFWIVCSSVLLCFLFPFRLFSFDVWFFCPVREIGLPLVCFVK